MEKKLSPEPLDPGQRVDFFLSHRSDIKPIVREVAEEIRKAGMTFWFDEPHARINESGVTRISRGLEQAEYLILFVTRNALQSGWVQAELESRIHKSGSYILLLVDVTYEEWQEIRPEVLAKHPVQLSDGLDRFIEQLRIIKAQLQPAPPVASEVASIVQDFQKWSSCGQGLEISIRGHFLELPILSELSEGLPCGVSVLKGGPGSGKTAALQALFRRSSYQAKLFLKMDFILDSIDSRKLEKLADQCARVARAEPVEVFIDSLDVLSVQRQTTGFRTTLNFLDRLGSLPGVSVLVACRDFDLKFDPSLRSRDWVGKFEIRPLEFTEHVAPLLEKIDEPLPQDADVRALLCVPQYLGLYATLRERCPETEVYNTQELYGLYLEQLVEQHRELGTEALSSLEAMASQLWCNRVQSLPRGQFRRPEFIRGLASLRIIDTSNPAALHFAHQTWLEYLVVREQLSKEKSLLEFILGQEQLPFCRPFVRSYFLYLVHARQKIAPELRAVFQSSDVTWHVKRLLVESLAEGEAPEAADSLIRYLSANWSQLLQVLLRSFSTDSWLDCLVKSWLPTAWTDPTQSKNLPWFLAGLRRFCDSRPVLALEIYLKALDSVSFWGFDSVIEKKSIARQPESRRIAESLLEREGGILGGEFARWLEFREEQDDELLWQQLIRGAKQERGRIKFGSRTTMIPDGFLAARFQKSDLLKTRMLDWILELEAQATCVEESSTHLILGWELRQHSSWAVLRHKGMLPHDGLYDLMEAFEQSVEAAACLNTPWWRARFKDLLSSELRVLHYICVKALVPAAEEQLVTAIDVIMNVSHLESGYGYEWSQLVRATIPLLEVAQREHFFEELLVNAERDEDALAVACCIQAIPCCYRSPEAQEALNKVTRRVSDLNCSRPIMSRSGYVRSPLNTEQLLHLSAKGILDLFAYYRQEGFEPSDWETSAFIGGEREMLRTLSTAASLHPLKFFDLLPSLEEDERIFWSVLEGIAESLRHSSGDLQSSLGDPVSQVDSQSLTKYVLALPETLKEETRYLDILLGCACDVGDGSLLSGLVEELSSFQGATYPSVQKEGRDGLFIAGLNSEQGTVCEALLILLGWQAENGECPDKTLLEHLATLCQVDRGPLRALVLRRLPTIIWHAPQVGWPLLEICLPSVPLGLWSELENCLYVNYAKHPEMVQGILAELAGDSLNKCGELWGRLTALMTLSGTTSFETLLSVAKDDSAVWNGAMNVFATNLAHGKEHLLALLAVLPSGLVNTDLLSRSLFQEANFPHIDRMIVDVVLGLLGEAEVYVLFDIDKWLSWLSSSDAEFALDILEELDKFGLLGRPRFRALAPIFVALLREVDFRCEPDFTARVVSLHDRIAQIEPSVLKPLYEGLF